MLSYLSWLPPGVLLTRRQLSCFNLSLKLFSGIGFGAVHLYCRLHKCQQKTTFRCMMCNSCTHFHVYEGVIFRVSMLSYGCVLSFDSIILHISSSKTSAPVWANPTTSSVCCRALGGGGKTCCAAGFSLWSPALPFPPLLTGFHTGPRREPE